MFRWSLLVLAFLLAGPLRANEAEHQEDTVAVSTEGGSSSLLSAGSPKETKPAQDFWSDPAKNLPSDKSALTSALNGPLSHRQALQLRSLLENGELAPWQKSVINARLTVYSSDLADRERIPAPDLSDEARRDFLSAHLKSLTDEELAEELNEFRRQADELVSHAGQADEQGAQELKRLADAVQTLDAEKENRKTPDKKTTPNRAIVKKIPVAPGSDRSTVHWVDPERWQKNDTVVITADYTKPGVDNPGGGIPGAIDNSVRSFRARGFEVILAGSPEEFERAAARVQERLKENPNLRVILDAHGQPGSAHFGPGFTLDKNNAKALGEKLKGVSEIFVFSCSFGGDPEPTRLLAEGAQTHVMSSDKTMYGVVGRGDAPGVHGDSNFVHAFPETGPDGKKIAEADIKNPKFGSIGRLLFDPKEGGPGNRVIRPGDQQVIPPGGGGGPRPPDGDRVADGDPARFENSIPGGADGEAAPKRVASEARTRQPANSPSSSQGSASNPGLAQVSMPSLTEVPKLELPSPPKDLMLDFRAAKPREPSRIEFAAPVVFAPLLPTLRKLSGEKATN